MKPALRWTLLLSALGATLVAMFAEWPGDSPEPARAGRAAAAATSTSTGPAAQPPSRRASAAERAPAARMQPVGPNLFAVREVQARQAARPAAPPPAPVAPPLPFRYQGKVIEDGRVVAFLAEGARTLIVRAGDRLPGYLVEEISPAGMTLVYLPLNEKQQLMFGSSN